MSEWSAGYVSDIDYTYGYYGDLNPVKLRLPFLREGIVFPRVETACELGFGQGVSVNIHAAAGDAEWYGTDFNPAQAGFARELAVASGGPIQVADDAFADYCQRSDLPDFDFIVLHGIWSWISDDNRRVLVDFLRRKLRVGGVLYISYNTLPSWSSFMPIRNLMLEHTRLGHQGSAIGGRISEAIDFAADLLAVESSFARTNPRAAERIEKLREQQPEYLAHEYFNRDWHPMDFRSMAEWLEPAKLNYACSATYSEHINGLSLTRDQQAFLEKIPNRMFRESTRDILVNQQFRRDYWVKGRRELSPLDKTELLRQQRVVLVREPGDLKYKVKSTVGEVTLNADIYRPVIEIMSDHRIRSVAELESELANTDVNLGKLFEAIMVMVSQAWVEPVQDDAAIEAALPRTRALNQHFYQLSRSRGGLSHAASPVTGGGTALNRFEKVFVLAMQQGHKTVEEIAQFAWQLVASQGQLLTRHGETLKTAEENLAQLREDATQFLDNRLQALQTLRVI